MNSPTGLKSLPKGTGNTIVKQETLETSINDLGLGRSNCGNTEQLPGPGEHKNSEVNEDEVTDLGEVCRSLLATHSGDRPTQLELDMAWFLVSNCGEKQDAIMHAICVAAVHWGSHELWEKAVKTYLQHGPITWLQPQWLLDAIRKFGFQSMKSSLKEILQREDFVRPLVALFESLKTLVDASPHEELYRDTRLWISDTRRMLWQTIGRLAQTQVDRLIHQSLMKGGLSHLRDNIIPVCANVCSGFLLIELAHRVLSDEVFRCCSLEDKRNTIIRCLHAAIPQLNLGKATDPALTNESEDALRALLSTSSACGVVDEVLLRLLEHVDTKWKATIKCSIDLKVSVLVKLTGAPNIPLIPVRAWLVSVFNQALKGASTSTGSQYITLDLCAKRLQYLANLPEGLNSLLTSVRPRIDTLSYSELWPLLKVAEANLDDITKSPSLSEVHQLLLRRYIETFEFERGDAIIHLTTTCLVNHKSPDGLDHLANRISCLSDVYTPTCKTVRFWEHNCQLDLQVVDGKALLKAHLVKIRKMADDNGLLGPCGNAFCLLIMGWMQIDVRQPTSRSILPRWVPWVSPCSCRACWALEAFLHDPSDMAVQFEGLSISRRDHLVRQIQDSGLVQAAQIKFLHCYGDRVKVIKLPTVFQPIRSPDFRRDVQELFDIISPNPHERADILGPVYTDIVAWLEGASSSKRVYVGGNDSTTAKKMKLEI